MPVWTNSAQTEPECPEPVRELIDDQARRDPQAAYPEATSSILVAPADRVIGDSGWLVPSSISANPDEARACIPLPEFDALLLEKARVISGRFPLAEVEYRNLRGADSSAQHFEIPHFERVFRIAANLASVPNVHESPDYDAVLILTAWHSVRPGVEGFLGSYPKALLCPLSHTAPPTALDALSPGQRSVFQRRAPVYLRYLLCNKFDLRTCADIENADLRHLLRSTGFRLIRSSAVG